MAKGSSHERWQEQFDEAAKRGPYDEFPMFPPGIDPQIHVSRNNRPQPFHLICEHDTVASPSAQSFVR